MRGIDNAAYYRLVADQPGYYMDYTGTGNTLNMRHPHVLQLVMDSLRYWIEEMHVDGFRFDLAATLARGLHEVDRLGAFFDLIQQDPVVSRVKLIAEPWDVGEGGYQVGNFPPLWSEWNGKYRDWIRDYWRGEPGSLPELGARFTGSSDLYQQRRPVPAREHQLHHRARRLHAARPRLVQREAQRGERRGQPRRREPQPIVELRRRRADRRSRDQRAARAPAAQLPRDAVPLAGRADAARRRRDRPHAARQQQRATARTTRSRGSTGSTPTSELLEFARQLSRAAPRSSGVSPARLVPGPADPRRTATARRCPTSRGSRPRATRWTDEHWESAAPRSLQVFLNGAGDPRSRRARRADPRRLVPHRLPRASRGPADPATRAPMGRGVGARARYRARLCDGGRALSPRAHRSLCPHFRSGCSGGKPDGSGAALRGARVTHGFDGVVPGSWRDVGSRRELAPSVKQGRVMATTILQILRRSSNRISARALRRCRGWRLSRSRQARCAPPRAICSSCLRGARLRTAASSTWLATTKARPSPDTFS